MTSVGVVDLTVAAAAAAELSRVSGHPMVVVGALALAAHGYQRQTSDVDIAIPVLIGQASGAAFESAVESVGLEVRAKHKFGGYDLRTADVRIDVLTVNRDAPHHIQEAVEEAVASNRVVDLFGQQAFVVSLGHLIALKLIAERKKDLADIVELIKVHLEARTWSEERAAVRDVVTRHLDSSLARMVDELAADARDELGSRFDGLLPQRGFDGVPFKVCSGCGRGLTRTQWAELPLVGYQVVPPWQDDPGEVLELRNCDTCRSTLTITMPFTALELEAEVDLVHAADPSLDLRHARSFAVQRLLSGA